MIEYSQIKVSDLRQDIIDKGIMSKEEVDCIKGKSKLVELHKKLYNESSSIINTESKKETEQVQETQDIEEKIELDTISFYEDDQETEETEETEEEKDEPTIPDYGSEEWSSYVMDQFLPSELDQKGHPKIAGLRRLVGLLIGDIIDSGPIQIIASNDSDGPGRASVLVKVVIEWDGTLRIFRAAADAWHGNTDDEYAVYPMAIAETRAEARALKRALGLIGVTADELTSQDTKEIVEQYKDKQDTTGEWEDGQIKHEQIRAVTTMCTRLEIDIDKFINSGESDYDSITNVSRSNAIKMIKQLNRYQTNNVEIPTEIKETN